MILRKTRPPMGWDSRAWIVGCGLSSLAGLFFAAGIKFHQWDWDFMSAFMTGCIVNPWPANTHVPAFYVIVASLVLLPILLSLLARRRYLLWGILPALIIQVWIVAGMVADGDLARAKPADFVNPGWMLYNLEDCFKMLCLCLFTSAPVALARFLYKRSKKTSTMEEAVAVTDVAAYSNRDVWPPPPRSV